MIRRLRFKLVVACMVSLLIVLTVIMSILNIVNYREIVRDADSILNLLKENSGRFPIMEEFYDWRVDGPRYKSPELPFEIRYFSVLMTEEGALKGSESGQISALDGEKIADHAMRAFRTGDERGFVDDYRFYRYPDGSDVRIVFLDYGRALSYHNSVLRYSIMISAAGLLAVFALILILSGRIIRPIAENYEKQRLFITDAGHEIKTPITLIDAAVSVLEMEGGENEWLRGIRTQTGRLGALTGDLIRLARMEESGDLPMMDFPLSELVDETAAPFMIAAKAQNRDLRVYIQPGIVICGHADSFRQLISILLDNALKYSPEGGAIRLRLERRGRTIALCSENESLQPLTKAHLGSLFDRFYRGDASRSSRMQGHGIGLSIAKAIVTSHKGKIGAAADGNTLIITATFPN